jgi:peptidylprolyl isomerase
LSEDNLKAADAFLAKNAQDSGVKTLVPGKLQYIVLHEGTGSLVPEHGTPSIKYTAKYIDGTVFDSSEAAGGPITIPLDQTIPGFSKGIAGMKEGEKRRLFVHPDLAYGKTGQLPPNSALIFEVEVVKAASDSKNLSDASDDIEQEDDGIIIDDEELNNTK